jgi:hypothetical protein
MKKRGNPNFVKGHVEPGAGRPKGAKDKKWATLEYWFGLIEDDWERLEPEKRVELVSKFVGMVLPRRTLPPETPAESKMNADKLWEEIKREEGTLGTQPGSNKTLLGDGTAQIQAPATATQGL